jgi:excisionase family DNA binding protein
MRHRLHPEEVPKTLADYESWLKAELEGLQEAVDFCHNVPEAIDDQVFRYAADRVVQAGIFGLPFMPAHLLGELCRSRTAMSAADAAICIRRCLDWCEEKRSLDQPPSGSQPQPIEQNRNSAPSEYLSIKDAAKVVGLSQTKIRREVNAGRLSASDTGTAAHPHYRIARADLQAWMEKNKGGTEVPPKNPVFNGRSRVGFSAKYSRRGFQERLVQIGMRQMDVPLRGLRIRVPE